MANFVPRLTDAGVNGGTWWYSSGNPFYPAGYGMPNCTCYAYGRYAEARGAWASLPTGNAKDWYDAATSFSRGPAPALGAVMCWGTTGSGPGHVAVVEQIGTGTVTISESHYTSGLPYWDLQTLTAASGYSHPYLGSSYYLQGFIYNLWAPGSGGGGTPLPSASWHNAVSGGYSRTSQEAFDNAICTFRKLSSLGWTVNAVAAVYGNMEAESGYNPWRWESDAVPYYANTPSYGYGLVQFTPSSKYISSSAAQGYSGYGPNWADHTGSANDGDAQLEYIHNYADYYSTTAYPMGFDEFRTSTLDAGTLARAWLYNYERPADPTATEDARAEAGQYWYNILSIYSGGGFNPGKIMAAVKRGASGGYIWRKRIYRY